MLESGLWGALTGSIGGKRPEVGTIPISALEARSWTNIGDTEASALGAQKPRPSSSCDVCSSPSLELGVWHESPSDPLAEVRAAANKPPSDLLISGPELTPRKLPTDCLPEDGRCHSEDLQNIEHLAHAAQRPSSSIECLTCAPLLTGPACTPATHEANGGGDGRAQCGAEDDDAGELAGPAGRPRAWIAPISAGAHNMPHALPWCFPATLRPPAAHSLAARPHNHHCHLLR